VFISYARADRRAAERLYTRLRQEGFIDPWFDLRELAPGVVWEKAIRSAIRQCDAAVIAISLNIRPDSFVHTEVRILKARSRRSGDGTPTLFPVKLVPCDVPQSLLPYQFVELYKPGGYDWMIAELRNRTPSAL
jgi:hypothetical protein